MSRVIPLVVALLASQWFAGAGHAQITPPAGAAGAGTAPVTGIPYGPANPRALSDPSGIGNAASVPPLRSNTPMITVPQGPLPGPSRAAAPTYYPYASQQPISAHAIEPRSRRWHRRRSHREVSSFTGICRGC
ncbi:MAG TPA: hypothetical protein VFL62_18660 [Bradyrhizobium sp.]|uniref:hypothetical protein n=1 Tax=Bradyrhizobium sp. TaxID=376 RepID=UPI002D8085C4|nr:hypothetical protein [Bradyrhizobium sp.]HET7888249.1 hypothetical protein [Bradyrhizobium sp.]